MGIADVRWRRFEMHPREICVSARLGPVVCCCEFANEHLGSLHTGRIYTANQILFG